MTERALRQEVLTSVRGRAADLAGLAEGGTAPERLVNEHTDDEFIQVVDSDGAVVASSPELRGQPAVVQLGSSQWTVTRVQGDDEDFLAYAITARAGDGPYHVILGRTLEPVAEATALVGGLLTVGLPFVLAFVALTTWLVVGWALAPVERMRREVDAITAHELSRRVDTPPSADEISRLARTMNRLLDRLEASQIRQRQFISDTSHELRSPIASIRQQAEVAHLHPDRVELRVMSGSILADTQRLQSLVEDLLFLARSDEQTLALQSSAVDLDDLVYEAARGHRGSPGAQIDVTGVHAVRVLGDERLLRRVVGNVLDNAVRVAMSTVRVSLAPARPDGAHGGRRRRGRHRARVTVSACSTRFVRLDEDRARTSGGAGLGLSIVAEVVRAHQGTVGIDDSPLGGARVEVRIPLAPEGR